MPNSDAGLPKNELPDPGEGTPKAGLRGKPWLVILVKLAVFLALVALMILLLNKLLVKEDKNYSVYKTTKYILFHCKIERRLNVANWLNEIISLMNKFISIIRSV